MSNLTKGYVLVIVSTLCYSVSLHLSKAALEYTTPATGAVFAITSAALAYFIAGIFARISGKTFADLHKVNFSGIKECIKEGKWFLLIAPVCGGVAGILINMANKTYGASTTAFLSNFLIVFLVLGGIFSGEKINKWEMISIFLIISGAFLFSYQQGKVQWSALGIMSACSLFMALKQIFIKHVSGKASLPCIMTTQLFFAGLTAAIIGAATGKLEIPAVVPLLLLIGSGVLNSTIGMNLLYSAYKYIGMSRGAPINTCRPLLVLLIGILLGRDLPTAAQTAGGAVIIIGTLWLYKSSKKSNAENNSENTPLQDSK
ncbi:MAG: DMT family transporter [Planctomycetota bacterium]|jgi:drug/metabolite transporter (DMT)-like permease